MLELLAIALAAAPTPLSLPARPALVLAGDVLALDASGPRIAAVMRRGGGAVQCRVVVGRPASPGSARALPGVPAACRDEASGVFDADVELGGTAVAAILASAETPHGELFELWTAHLPGGSLIPAGEWSRTDSDLPGGCWRHTASGGGVVAIAPGPNVQDGVVEGVACAPPAGGGTTRVRLLGAARPELVMPGAWTLLATDGRRVVVARLDDAGAPTGELVVVATDGATVPPPAVPPATVRAALTRGGAFGPQPPEAWLAPEAFVLRTDGGLRGYPSGSRAPWSVSGAVSLTVAGGRLFYVRGKALRARRLADGLDRLVAGLPRLGGEVAAGSFGLAVALPRGQGRAARTDVFRLRWRAVDRVLSG